MEKVWEELKKIEAQADQIKSQAESKAKEIVSLSKQEAEKLIVNSKTYGQEEAEKQYKLAIDEANSKRQEQLKVNQQETGKLKLQAEKRMEQASLEIVKAVLGENTA